MVLVCGQEEGGWRAQPGSLGWHAQWSSCLTLPRIPHEYRLLDAVILIEVPGTGPGEAVEDARVLGPLHLLGDLDEAPDSWFQHHQMLVIVVIQGSEPRNGSSLFASLFLFLLLSVFSHL